MAAHETLVADHDYMYPQGAGVSRKAKEQRFIRTYCNHCPIKKKCEEYGRDQKDGIWGGTTEQMREERRAILAMFT